MYEHDAIASLEALKESIMKKFSIAIIFVAITGCATLPMGDSKLDAALKAFKIDPDKAGIYIYRMADPDKAGIAIYQNENIRGAIKMDVTVDGQSIGKTVSKTYLFKEVTPGKHTVSSSAENTDTLEVDVKQGTLVYIWQELKMGLNYARTELHLVSEDEGRKGVREASLAVMK